MRLAERLDGFYRELKKIHNEQFQDWRFGQLMSNFIQFMAVEKKTDIFFPEENRMLEYIREFADEYGSKPKKITAKDIANILNGNQYGDEFAGVSLKGLKDEGFVVVTGYSDDLIDFHGAISAEFDCFDGGMIVFDKYGNTRNNQCRNAIRADWYTKHLGETGVIPWSFETDIPHEKFIIEDEGLPWCEGIVFSVEDLN